MSDFDKFWPVGSSCGDLPSKFRDDPSCVGSLIAILVLGLWRRLVRF